MKYPERERGRWGWGERENTLLCTLCLFYCSHKQMCVLQGLLGSLSLVLRLRSRDYFWPLANEEGAPGVPWDLLSRPRTESGIKLAEGKQYNGHLCRDGSGRGCTLIWRVEVGIS